MIEFTYRSWLGGVQPPLGELTEALAVQLAEAASAPRSRWIELDPLTPAWISDAVRAHAASIGAEVRSAIRVDSHLIGRGGLVVCSAPDLAGRWPTQGPVGLMLCVEHVVASSGTVEAIEIRTDVPHAESQATGTRAPGPRLARRVRQVAGIGLRWSPDPAWCLIDLRRPVSPVLAAMRAAGVVAGEPLDGPGWGGVVAAVVRPDTPDLELAEYAAALGDAIGTMDDRRSG